MSTRQRTPSRCPTRDASVSSCKATTRTTRPSARRRHSHSTSGMTGPGHHHGGRDSAENGHGAMGFAAMFVSHAFLSLSPFASAYISRRNRIDVRSPPSSLRQSHTRIVNVIALSQAYTPPLVSSHRIPPTFHLCISAYPSNQPILFSTICRIVYTFASEPSILIHTVSLTKASPSRTSTAV